MKGMSLKILDEIRATVSQMDEKPLFLLANAMADARRIFVTGRQRGALTARSFAMRLTHLNYPVYVVGEPTTPGITFSDLLIVFPGYGESRSLLDTVRQSYRVEASIAVFTPTPSSPLADLADHKIVVPRPQGNGASHTQSSGILFDQCCSLLSETLIQYLASRKGVPTRELLNNFSNLV